MKKLKRIYYTWDKWECYKAGFFEDTLPNNMSIAEGEAQYAKFFRIPGAFEHALERVITEWKHSCEHNLTNENMNRIAWLGQASMCIVSGIPSSCRAGFNLLTEDEQNAANATALKYLNIWLTRNGYPETDGVRKHKSADLY